MIKWNTMESVPKNRKVLLLFYDRIISSGEYRQGVLGEPQQEQLVWRCDCCGRFGSPTGWSEI